MLISLACCCKSLQLTALGEGTYARNVDVHDGQNGTASALVRAALEQDSFSMRVLELQINEKGGKIELHGYTLL